MHTAHIIHTRTHTHSNFQFLNPTENAILVQGYSVLNTQSLDYHKMYAN